MSRNKSRNIINISSDLGIIAPNQSIYGNKKTYNLLCCQTWYYWF